MSIPFSCGNIQVSIKCLRLTRFSSLLIKLITLNYNKHTYKIESKLYSASFHWTGPPIFFMRPFTFCFVIFTLLMKRIFSNYFINNNIQMLDWIFQKSEVKSHGQYNFFVDVQTKSIETNTNIMLTCYSSKNKQSVIPCNFIWYRSKNGLSNIVTNIKGSTYMCEPSDLGAIIKAEITSLDQQSRGKAFFEFGPVKIDVLTKKSVQNIVTPRLGNFHVYLSNKTRQRQCYMKILEDIIILKDSLTQNSYRFQYSLNDPNIQLHGKDNTRIIIRLNGRAEQQFLKFNSAIFADTSRLSESQVSEKRLQIKFMNRSDRDVFLFSLKCFIAKKQIKTAFILNKIENPNIVDNEVFNNHIEIQSLKSDILRLVSLNRDSTKEKQFYQAEVKRLEQEMETIILTYTKIVQDRCKNQVDFNQSYSVLTNKRDQILFKKNRNMEQENRDLEGRIRVLTEQLQYYKSMKDVNGDRVGNVHNTSPFAKKTAPFEEIQMKMQELSKINNKLNTQNSKLKLVNQSLSKQRSVENILEELNEQDDRDKEIIIQQLNRSIINLKKQKQFISQQLDTTLRKNQQLQKVLRQSPSLGQPHIIQLPSRQNISVRFQHHKDQNSVYHNQSVGQLNVNTSALIAEINELKRQNQKLYVDNVNLNSAKNNEINSNIQLKKQNQKLKEQINVSMSHSRSAIQSLNLDKSRGSGTKNDEELKNLSNRNNSLINQNIELRKSISSLQSELQSLRQQNIHYKSELSNLKSILIEKQAIILELQTVLKNEKEKALNTSTFTTTDSKERYKKKIQQLKEEIQMLRRNADVMNKSSMLAGDMDSYHQQQKNYLKQQNELLIQQNEKLTSMCNKYMKEVKQIPKLRAQNVQLKIQLDNYKSGMVSISNR